MLEASLPTPDSTDGQQSSVGHSSPARLPPLPIPRLRVEHRSSDAQEVIDGLAQRFADFLRRVEAQRSPVTLKWYGHVFKAYRIYLEDSGATTAAEMKACIRDLDGFTDWNLRRRVSRITANTYWRALRPFFNDWEQREGVVNPYRKQKPPGFDPAMPKALAPEDCTRILFAAANYRRWSAFERTRATALIGVMLYAGLRRSEALALAVSDVNFRTAEICVRHGKGPWGGKKRFVPIHGELAPLLQAYVGERAKKRITDEAPEFFSSTRATGGIGPSSVGVIVRTLVRASGIRFSPHMLRHSFVTHLLRSNVPLYVARDLAGHSHVETTLLYTKVFAKDRHENLQKLSFE